MKLLNFKKGKKVCEHSVYTTKSEEKADALTSEMLQDTIERLRQYGHVSQSVSGQIVVMNANREVIAFNSEDTSLIPIGIALRDSGAGETIEVSLFGNDDPSKEDEETDLGNLTGDREIADAENQIR